MVSQHKMKKISLNILIIITCLLIAACGKPNDMLSPDGSLLIRPNVKKGIVRFSILDTNNKILHVSDTGASSFHRWSFEWQDDSTILFKSSDIGPSKWKKQKNGSWRKTNPLRKLSPDGKLVIYTWWNSYKEKTITISILKADGNANKATNVIGEIETKIVIPDLIDCARWDGNNKFVIMGQDKNYIFNKKNGDYWIQQ